MKFKETKIKGLYIIEPELKIDKRGYFFRVFCERELAEIGIEFKLVQINQSLAKKKGTIRGLHFQQYPHREAKFVQCLKGRIYDVVVDLRKDSYTYMQWVGVELSKEGRGMFLVPKGCAHGFQTLEDNSEVQYFVSEYYAPEYENGIRWDDPSFNIKWPIEPPFLLERDKNWPLINS